MKPALAHPCNTHAGSRPSPRLQYGLTLTEVMIAITISLILLAGVMQIFTGSRQTYRVQDNMARLQENGRFAIDFLSRDIRMADHWGCLKNTATLANNLTGNVSMGTVAGLAGTEGAGGAPDTITLATAVPSGIIVNTQMPNSSANIFTNSNAGLVNGGIVIVSNCSNGDIFQITQLPAGGGIQHNSGAGTPGNTFNYPSPTCPGSAHCLSADYGPGAEIMDTQIVTYSIASDGTNNNRPTLYRSASGMGVAAAAAQPLVEGVETMQILYGEDLDANRTADRYVPANTAGLVMNNVVSVRIGLVLVTAENNLAATPQTYTFNGAPVTATDRRLRRVFSSTIQLRNRV